MGLQIISLYRIDPNKKYGVFDVIPYGVYIAPFYGGDNLHHLTLLTDYDFRERLDNERRLFNSGRADIAPLEFYTHAEAEAYASQIAFPGWVEEQEEQ